MTPPMLLQSLRIGLQEDVSDLAAGNGDKNCQRGPSVLDARDRALPVQQAFLDLPAWYVLSRANKGSHPTPPDDGAKQLSHATMALARIVCAQHDHPPEHVEQRFLHPHR